MSEDEQEFKLNEQRVQRLARESMDVVKSFHADARPRSVSTFEALQALAIVVSQLLHEAGDGRVDQFFHEALQQQYAAGRVIKREVDLP